MPWWSPLAVVAGGAAAIAVTRARIPTLRRWWRRRSQLDPARDPAAAWVTPAVERALAELVLADETPQITVERGLLLCEVDPDLSWRGGLRRLLPAAARLGDTTDDRALRAELWWRLGRVDDARRACASLPPDHWRACAVRAGLYELAGDPERSDSAWVAAAQLAPPSERARLYRRLRDQRRRRGASVGQPLTLWERPPDAP
ncbi:MAG: hypothetical protein ABMA64_08925 [Myxococcota bacterium]